MLGFQWMLGQKHVDSLNKHLEQNYGGIVAFTKDEENIIKSLDHGCLFSCFKLLHNSSSPYSLMRTFHREQTVKWLISQRYTLKDIHHSLKLLKKYGLLNETTFEKFSNVTSGFDDPQSAKTFLAIFSQVIEIVNAPPRVSWAHNGGPHAVALLWDKFNSVFTLEKRDAVLPIFHNIVMRYNEHSRAGHYIASCLKGLFAINNVAHLTAFLEVITLLETAGINKKNIDGQWLLEHFLKEGEKDPASCERRIRSAQDLKYYSQLLTTLNKNKLLTLDNLTKIQNIESGTSDVRSDLITIIYQHRLTQSRLDAIFSSINPTSQQSDLTEGYSMEQGTEGILSTLFKRRDSGQYAVLIDEEEEMPIFTI